MDYNPRQESTITTSWIRLPGLPLPMYDRALIEGIVSPFGRLVDVDVENEVAYCTKCKIHGHTISTCKKNQPRPVFQVAKENDKGIAVTVLVEAG
ncbi:hypothetical protein QQ045_019206 [Rhodiola kirilowii]